MFFIFHLETQWIGAPKQQANIPPCGNSYLQCQLSLQRGLRFLSNRITHFAKVDVEVDAIDRLKLFFIEKVEGDIVELSLSSMFLVWKG